MTISDAMAPSPQRWIGVDGRGINLQLGTGVSTYGRGLIEAIGAGGFQLEMLLDCEMGHDSSAASSRIPGWERARRWLRAVPATPRDTMIRSERQRVGSTIAGRTRIADDIFRVAQVHFDLYGRPIQLVGLNPPAVMHWTYPVPIVFKGALNIYCIHDLIPLSTPELTPISTARHRRLLKSVLAVADHIVTVSEASKRAIADEFDYPADKITNAYQAPARCPAESARADQKPPHGLAPRGFFLCLGTIETRKNTGRLIDAYLTSGARAPLVLAGPRGWNAAAEMEAARGHMIDAMSAGRGEFGILELGYQSRNEIHGLLQNAKALLFPSLAEGFGLPIVEAMMLGTPVMTSRGGATGEVADDAALLVDPRDRGQMATAIERLESDPTLRASLREKGVARSAEFSGARYAARLAAMYENILAYDGRAPKARDIPATSQS